MTTTPTPTTEPERTVHRIIGAMPYGAMLPRIKVETLDAIQADYPDLVVYLESLRTRLVEVAAGDTDRAERLDRLEADLRAVGRILRFAVGDDPA